MNLHVRGSSSGQAADDGVPAVVFLHGFPFDGSLWDPQLEAMPDGWRGLAPDLRGFGRTGIQDLPGEVPTGRRIGNRIARDSDPVLTMACLADDVAELIDGQAGGKAVVCGLSMGGYVALELWRRHPDRVRALVLADTRADADDDEGRENRLRMAQSVRSSGLDALAAAMIPSLLSRATRNERSDVVDHVRGMILGTSPTTVIAALAGMAARHDSTAELAAIDLPTLVVTGAEDVITTPETARTMAERLPRAELVEIAEAGHLSNLENAGAFNRAMGAFLREI